MVDALALGASEATHGGSSPLRRTIIMQVIYIPGLGDNNPRGQQLAVSLWRYYGVRPQLFQMKWHDGEAFAPKFERLIAAIDAALAEGPVALVCASAGATAAIQAYVARPQLVGVVCIAGKINRPEAVGASYKRRSPAFWQAAQRMPDALASLSQQQRQHMVSIRGLIDPIVPKVDSRLSGAHNRISPSIGHAFTIAIQLIFGAPGFINFLKHQQKQL